MKSKYKISVEKERILFEYEDKIMGISKYPVFVEIWNGLQNDSVKCIKTKYSQINKQSNIIEAKALIKNSEIGTVSVHDIYQIDKYGIILTRKVHVNESGTWKGIRLCTEMLPLPEEKNQFEDLRYFAPPAIFDKNDLDEDGYEDYFHTKKVIFREDRFNYPMFMCYSENSHFAVRIERETLPKYDSIPERKTSEETGELEAFFLQRTDIGSIGADGSNQKELCLKASYPFAEGDATIALYILKTIPFGAFWPLKTGESFTVSYRFSMHKHVDFHAACWYNVSHVIQTKKPEPAPFALNPEEIVKYRLDALDQYYIEKSKEEDRNEPAGYVLNCHPQKGEQLENIIQYGFTGQNILNAYHFVRYGYEHENVEYVRRGLKTADFFANVIHIKESGMFYNLYNIDNRTVSFWWTGLLLPLAYAQGEELEKLMGPLYEYRKNIIDTLLPLKGAYLRCMNEDVTALLRLYILEKIRDQEHLNWKDAIFNYAEFLLKTQEDDGGWYRAYDLEGKPILDPEIWFGGTIYEKKSSTGTSITFLTELYQLTGEQKYLDAAYKAGLFVIKYIIDRVRFNGGVHDSIYAKGQLIDNESILYPMFGMLSLYEATKEKIFLDNAIKAAHFYASWVCLWNVPLPPNSTLAKYGFNSIGMGACDTCGAGYVHPFQLMGVAELAQIAVYAHDKELLEAARLYWHGCNQTVELPERSWGYAKNGFQEEGYLISWWAVDDPMFSADTGFGHRLKGEGNKTCFPWIPAVGIKGYWALLDRFKTTDFSEIYRIYL